MFRLLRALVLKTICGLLCAAALPFAVASPIPACGSVSDITSLVNTTCTIGYITYTFTKASYSSVNNSLPPNFTIGFTPTSAGGNPGFLLGSGILASPGAVGSQVDLQASLSFTFTSTVAITSVGVGFDSNSVVTGGNATDEGLLIADNFMGGGTTAEAQIDSGGRGSSSVFINPDVEMLSTAVTSGNGLSRVGVSAWGNGTAFLDPAGFFANPPANLVIPPSEVPEPGSLLLLGTSLLGFAGVVRRKLRQGKVPMRSLSPISSPRTFCCDMIAYVWPGGR